MTMQQIQTASQHRQHAQRQHVDLEQPDQIEIVLVPLDHRALRHGGVFHRHQCLQRSIRDHEPARMLGEVARKADQRTGQHQQTLEHGLLRLETLLSEPCFVGNMIGPAPGTAGEPVDTLRREAQCPADIADRSSGVVMADHGGQRRAMAAVAAEDVLDHLLAALMLEIDIDIRRLVAFAGDEALEQQRRARRIDLGDSQRVADRRVGRRAAPLAQDVLPPREVDDVMHGEEIVLVAELIDQCELVVDLRGRLLGHAIRPASRAALSRQLAQPLGRRLALRHHLVGIGVVQLAEIEVAARRQRHALGHQLNGIDRGQRIPAAQMALAVGEQRVSRLEHAQVVTNRGEAVLQRPPAPGMHVNVSRRQYRNAQLGGQRLQSGQTRRVVAAVLEAVVKLHRQPQPIGEGTCQPLAHLIITYLTIIHLMARHCLRNPQREQAVTAVEFVEIRGEQPILALGRASANAGDQSAERLVATPVFHQQHQLDAALGMKLGTDDQRDAMLPCRLPAAHDAGQRSFVGDRQGTVTEPCGALEKLVRGRRAALKAEGGEAVQLGIGDRIAHPNHPCRYQPCRPGSHQTQAWRPSAHWAR